MAGKGKRGAVKATVEEGTFSGADDLQAKFRALARILGSIEFRGEDKAAVSAVLDVLNSAEIEQTERGLKIVSTSEDALKVYNLIQYGYEGGREEAAKKLKKKPEEIEPNVSGFELADVSEPDRMVDVLRRYVNISQSALDVKEAARTVDKNNYSREIAEKADEVAAARIALAGADETIANLERENSSLRAQNNELQGNVYVQNSFLRKVFGKKDKDTGEKKLTLKRASRIATVAAAAMLAITVVSSAVLGAFLGGANKRANEAQAEVVRITSEYNSLNDQYQDLYDEHEETTGKIDELQGVIDGIEGVLNDNGYETENVNINDLIQTIIDNTGDTIIVGGDVQKVYADILNNFVSLGLNLSDLQDENGNFTASKVDAFLKEHVENVVKNANELNKITGELNNILGTISKRDENGNETGEKYSLADFETTAEAFDLISDELDSYADKLDDLQTALDNALEQNNGYALEIKELTNENEELTKTIVTLNGNVLELNGTIEDLQKTIATQKDTIASLQGKVSNLQSKYNNVVDENAKLKAENKELAEQIEDLKEENDKNQSNGEQSTPSNPDNEQGGGSPVGDQDPDKDTHPGTGDQTPPEDDELEGPGKS